MQPTQSSMLCRTDAGTTPRTTTSETAKRPPGRSTRKASLRTRALSADKLMTQFEMMTSTESSEQRDVLYLAFQELDVRCTRLPLILTGQSKHVVGHVETVGFAGRPYTPG